MLQNPVNPDAELRVPGPEVSKVTPRPSEYLLGKVGGRLASREITVHQIAQVASDFLDQKGLRVGIPRKRHVEQAL
jgi:hypothetical protein